MVRTTYELGAREPLQVADHGDTSWAKWHKAFPRWTAS